MTAESTDVESYFWAPEARRSDEAFAVSVIGTGYLGAVHAACLAHAGHTVVGVDVDASRVEALNSGKAPFFEPGLDELLGEGLSSGRLHFTTDYAEAAGSTIHFICVGTPQLPSSDGADLGYLWHAAESLARELRGPALIVGKSTVPVGTAARLATAIDGWTSDRAQVRLAWNPEFIREGYAVHDTLRPDRLVFGVADEGSSLLLSDMYATVVPATTPVVRTDLATAELAKVSANVMLAARISMMNVMAQVCEAADADILRLIEVLAHDKRIGPHFLTPGLGFGGGCLPKDLRAFGVRARELGLDEPVELLERVDTVNLQQRARLVELVTALVPAPLDGSVVAVLGTAFKAGSDDVRDSPALDVARRLQQSGARIQYYDPQAGDSTQRSCPQLHRATDVASACARADIVLLLTGWPEFLDLDAVALAAVVNRPVIVDARLALDPVTWRAAGWSFHGLGRGASSRG